MRGREGKGLLPTIDRGVKVRIIKFRSWDSRNKVMETPDNFANDIDGDKYQIMQYTGLKDYKGVEIYDCDIVSWQGAYIVWMDKLGCWGFTFKGHEYSTPLYHDDNLLQSQVVGNIYSTPELLE